MGNAPDRLYIDKKDRELYKELEDKEDMFKGMKNKDLFLMAMMIGFEHQSNEELKTRDGFFLEKDLNQNDHALLNAIAMHENNGVEVLKDMGEVYRIAEEYAHYGIRIIHDWISSSPYGTFPKKFESEILEKIKMSQ